MTRLIKQITILIVLVGVLFVFINFKKNNMIQKSGLKLTSTSFENNQQIPKQYTCSGININPSLIIDNVPKNTKSLALIIDDPDAPSGDWVHWLIWNISPEAAVIDENSVPAGAIQGLNDFKNNKYDGPCPPAGTHRYYFKLYALDVLLNLDKSTKKGSLENAMKGYILDETSLIGLYSK